jgi:dipeptidyl-peptidase-4
MAPVNRFKKITPEDLWDTKVFQTKTVHGFQSMKDGRHYTVLEDKKRIVKYRYSTGKRVSALFDVKQFKSDSITEIHSYTFSDDESKLLIAVNFKKLYRHSFFASFYILDLKKKTLQPLSDKKEQRRATFSPDGKKVAFVWKNNVYIKSIAGGQEVQVTRDGKRNRIINGAPDWVYEEEFGMPVCLIWSADSRRLAFYRFDESKVKEFDMSMYEGGYPGTYRYKYPRAGEKNAVVSVHVYDTRSRKTITVDTGKETDQYIPHIQWSKSTDVLLVIRLNRLQNKADFLLCDTRTGETECILTQTNERYVELLPGLTFLDDRKHFILLSEKDGWQHLCLYDLNGTCVRQLTKGSWNVTDFKGYDNKSGLLYFEASKVSPLQRHLYSIRLDGTGLKKRTPRKGMHRTVFSKGFRYFIDYYSGATSVPTVTLHDSSGKKIRVLEANADLKKTLRHYRVTDKSFFTFTTSEGIELNGWMILPPKFKPRKKYPVMMTVYGGPGSQTVTDSWQFGWERLLADKGYIIASVDGRGTGMRGEEFKKCTYLQLGNLETTDQIETAKHLGSLPYVDKKRIGMFGWSYGGFMSCNCIMRGANVFKTAVAVASVTHFRFYDTVYTERFMRTPQENPEGYNNYCPLAYVDKLKNTFLLVHGTADDNVHYQNSLELVDKLVQAKKQFEMHFIPNKAHGINGGNTHLHLFTRMMNFIMENL